MPDSHYTYAGTVPKLSWELGAVFNFVEVEVVEHPVEVGAGSTIVPQRGGPVSESGDVAEEDGLLGLEWLPGAFEGVIVVAIAIDVVGIDLLEVLLGAGLEEPAAG